MVSTELMSLALMLLRASSLRKGARCGLHLRKQQHLAWESLFLRLAVQWAFDEVLPSAALRHQVGLRLLDPEIRRVQECKFARRILENALTRLQDSTNSVSASQHGT